MYLLVFLFLKFWILINDLNLFLLFFFFFHLISSNKYWNKGFLFNFLDSKKNNDVFLHDLSNLLTIVFFKNEDIQLNETLSRIRLCLEKFNQKNSSNYLASNIVKDCVCYCGYRHNLYIKDDFEVNVDKYYLEVCVVCILNGFSRMGSNIVIGDSFISVVLKEDFDLNFLNKFDACVFNFVSYSV